MELPDFCAELLLLVVALLATIAGTRAFQSIATNKGIVANPNFRSLHQRPMPRGGGIVFSSVFLLAVAGLWLFGAMDKHLMWAIVLGGAVATVFGFVDDVIEIGTKEKLVVQSGLAAWVLFSVDGQPLMNLPGVPYVVDLFLSWFALVWLMNLYNFMDGIDGMAASGATFLCSTVIVSMFLTKGDGGVILILSLLAVCSFGFLLFNWPPASVFMGDSGSLFLGYCFGALIAKTVTSGQISLWTWLIVFSYFLGDTSTTTVLRMCMLKHWYGAHRSNAYQNLARIWGSHLKVVRGVCLFHIFWAFPLAVWSVLIPTTAPLATALAVIPVVIWTFRYGPRLSSS
jgi:Fuc2NAc and GlcNAc transferase